MAEREPDIEYCDRVSVLTTPKGEARPPAIANLPFETEKRHGIARVNPAVVKAEDKP